MTEATICNNKFCEQCHQDKPIEEFRRRYKDRDIRLNQCNSCHRQSERTRRQVHRKKQHRRQISKNMTGLINARDDQMLESLCSRMVSDFGGMNGVCSIWADFLIHSLKNNLHGAFRCIQTYFKLLETVENNRSSQTSVDTRTERYPIHKAVEELQFMPRWNWAGK